MQNDVGKENVCYIHLTLVPYIAAAKELKTKPTQHSVKELRGLGIQPDILLCRCDRPLNEELKGKIALFCNVHKDNVFAAQDVDTIYAVPTTFHKEGVDEKITEILNIWTGKPKISNWESILTRIREPENSVTIAIVGKYVGLEESYKSLAEALSHGGIANNTKVNLKYIDSEELESKDKLEFNKIFEGAGGVLVPGGFGDRGIEGKILAINYARKNKVPFFGICLGMQLAVTEYSRNMANLKDAHSEEFNEKSEHLVISLMEEQKTIANVGGTMRLGAYDCAVVKDSKTYEAYGTAKISERHRHRYEVNNKYKEILEKNNLKIVGMNKNTNLVEIVEIENHPWFVGVQFHPEFKSKPLVAHPLFSAFIKYSLGKNQ